MKKWILVLMLLIGMNSLCGAQGNFTKYFSYASNNIAQCIRETSDSNYIAALGAGPNLDHGIFLKLDTLGNIIWQHNDAAFLGAGDYVLENMNSDYTFLEEQTSGPYMVSMVLQRYSKTGAQIWNKFPLVPMDCSGGSLIEDIDSDLVVIGTLNASPQKVLLIKCNQLGDTIFTKVFNDSLNIQGGAIKRFNAGYLIGCGKYWNSSIESTVIIYVDTLGNELWRKEFKQSRYSDLKIVSSNSFAFSSSDYDSLTTIYTPKLTLCNMIGDTIFTHLYNLPISNVASALYYKPNIGYLISTNNEDVHFNGNYVLVTDTLGNLTCSILLPDSIYRLLPASLIKNYSGKIAICGIAYDSTNSVFNSFIAIIDTFGIEIHAAIPEINIKSSISLFPNPFSTIATLSIGNGLPLEREAIGKGEVRIINLLGQEVKTISIINQNEITINRDNLADGMYFYKIIGNKGETVGVGKMVVE